jgi:hypothetical protein
MYNIPFLSDQLQFEKAGNILTLSNIEMKASDTYHVRGASTLRPVHYGSLSRPEGPGPVLVPHFMYFASYFSACTTNNTANCTVRVMTGNETSPAQEYWE